MPEVKVPIATEEPIISDDRELIFFDKLSIAAVKALVSTEEPPLPVTSPLNLLPIFLTTDDLPLESSSPLSDFFPNPPINPLPN